MNSEKSRELALELEDEAQKFFLDLYPDPVFIFDEKGRVLFINKVGKMTFQYDKNTSIFLLKSELSKLKNIVKNYLSTSKNEYEFNFSLKEGEFNDYSIKIESYKNNGKKHLFLFFYEVTQKKIYEKLLTVEKEILGLIIDNMSLSQLLERITLNIEEIFPTSKASILLLDSEGQHIKHGAAPHLPLSYNATIEGQPIGPTQGSCGTAIYTRKPVIVSDIANDPLWKNFKSLADTYHLKACWSIPILNNQNQVIAAFALYFSYIHSPSDTDLDFINRAAQLVRIALELNMASTSLKLSEERFRLLSKATNDAIWDCNLLTNTMWWSEGFKTIFGYQLDSHEKNIQAWMNCIHPDDFDRVIGSIYKAINAGEFQWSEEYRFQRQDGSYSYVLDKGQIIRDETEKAVRMIGGMTDLTERMNLEEQLRQAQRLESLGQLTGGVANDFNNLLTIILGNAELLIEHLGFNPKLYELAEMINSAALKGAELTKRLLAFGRRQVLDPKPTDINLLLENMITLMQHTLGDPIQITFQEEKDLNKALIDPSQLENAILNLCLNARDAMPDGGKLIIQTRQTFLDEDYAKTHPEVKVGPYIQIIITDTGVGIPPENLRQVFEPFYTTKTKEKGTGLGLSMVFGFMKQSGGHINIYSEVNKGTSVCLYLPQHNTKEENRNEDLHQQYVNLTGHEKILLVEDNEKVRIYAKAQLEAAGYDVLTAENGLKALEILKMHNDFNLLFTDVIMDGGLSGKELATLALKLYPHLKILYTSGYPQDAIVHHGQLDPGVQLLTKPYRRVELLSKIKEILAES